MTTAATGALLAEVAPLVGRLGSAFYFAPGTLARGRALGLDGYRFYFLGRGGVLGDVEAPVVASAFGYFEPGLVAHMWSSARDRVPPRRAGRAYLECAHQMGRAQLGGVGGLGEWCAAAEAVAAAAELAGLALFAGVLGEPLPDDAPARAMQLLVLLRELRGSAHLLAVRAVGLAPRVAHYLRRPGDFTLFGWQEADVPEVTDADRGRAAAAEALTDELVAPAFEVLGEPERSALLAGLRAMAGALEPPRAPSAG